MLSVEASIPTFDREGFMVGLCRDSPFPQGYAGNEPLYQILVRAAGEVKTVVDYHNGLAAPPLFPSSRAFLALTLFAGPVRSAPAQNALLAIVMVGEQAQNGYSFEQALAKGKRHWDSGQPNGNGVFLGDDQVYEGDCNWGLSVEVDGLVVGAEGLTQFPARHAARVFASSVSTQLTVARHQHGNELAGRNLSEGRRPWLTPSGYYAGQHLSVHEINFVMGGVW